MSIEAINEALELLRIAQNNMGPGRSSLDDEERAHWDRISKCRQELEKLKQQKPAAFAVLADSGNAVRIWWSGAERERAERIAAEDFQGMPFVSLYAAPVPAAVLDGWKLVPLEPTVVMESAGADALEDRDAATSLCADAANTYRSMLSAAPAAPAVPDQWSLVRKAVAVAIEACKSATGERSKIDLMVNGNQITHDVMGTDTTWKSPAMQKGGE